MYNKGSVLMTTHDPVKNTEQMKMNNNYIIMLHYSQVLSAEHINAIYPAGAVKKKAL